MHIAVGSSVMAGASGSSGENRRNLASEHFIANFPASAKKQQVTTALRILESARSEMQARLAAASLAWALPKRVELYVHESTGNFSGVTGQPAWVAATILDHRIQLQPVEVLIRRRILEKTLRHEYAHLVIGELSKSRAPRWLAEGLAIHFAGEALQIPLADRGKDLSIEQIESGLKRLRSPAEMRNLYAEAHKKVSALIEKEGEAAVWRRVGLR